MSYGVVARFARRVRVAAACLVATTLAACTGGPEQRIGAANLQAAIEAGNPPLIVDVRTTGEYEAGHVPGAVHLPFYQTWSRAAELPAAKNDEIVVYCEHGPRAGLARMGLESSGFEHVRYLEGHMDGWREAGRPIETGVP